jgi:hypothetical protein
MQSQHPNTVAGCQNAALVIMKGGESGTYDYSKISSIQKLALRQYVQQGGNLYVELCPGYVSKDWFGASLWITKEIASACRYSFSSFLEYGLVLSRIELDNH